MREYRADHQNEMRIRYGWRLSENGYQMIDPVQRDTILKILALRKTGNSLQQIADHLNANNYPTSRNGKWYCATVKKIIDQNTHLQK